ncbi:SGNH/GDSL hydrolase family protein [Niallia nealsonii]|uniref:SGNH/GDSL hydrolase family protein n=1 Tax=Niallia nealsonii TaxID=115979 RepID=UPI0012FF2030|nr:GDSL-type esterase/lipase family protein [Niallia nealsonii]
MNSKFFIFFVLIGVIITIVFLVFGQENKKSLETLKKDNIIKNANDIEIRNTKTDIFDKLNRGEDVTIVFLGDSTTEQNKYTNGKAGHVELINKALSHVYGDKVTVINAGVSGNTIIDMAKRLDSDVLRYKPDLVIINSGINDARKGVSMADFKTTYENIIKRIKNESDATIILRTSNVTLGEKINYMLREKINPIVKSISKEYDIGFIDLYSYYAKVIRNDPAGIDKYNYNRLHPNEIGQKVISDLILYSLLNPKQ